MELDRCSHQGEVYGLKLRAFEFLWGRVFDLGVIEDGFWERVLWAQPEEAEAVERGPGGAWGGDRTFKEGDGAASGCHREGPSLGR